MEVAMTNEQKYKIAELRQSGYGYANIADALGLTKNQVSAYCRRAGLTGTKAAVGATDVPACQLRRARRAGGIRGTAAAASTGKGTGRP